MGQAGDDPRYPVHAPGWAALDRALSRLYPGQTPHQFASQRAYDLQGRSPLPAVVAYEARGPEHWHLVGYGLSELFDKSSPDPEHSGHGFELSLRLPRRADDERPPGWAVQLIQALGHYVLSGHGQLDTGHIIDLGGPLVPPALDEPDAPPCTLEGVVCVPDPELGKLDTVHGAVLLLQLFGLTRDELRPMEEWTLERKVGLVLEAEPLAITDPRRGSMRDDPRRATLYRRYELGIMI